MQKKIKKYVVVLFGIKKNLFLHSQTTTIWGGRREGLSTGNCSLKE